VFRPKPESRAAQVPPGVDKSRLAAGQGTLLGRVRADRAGASLIIFAIALPVLLGFAGLGVEVSHWYLVKRKLQEAVDSAAMAGAFEYRNNVAATQATLDATAATAVTKSGFPAPTSLEVYNPPQTGLYAPGGANDNAAAVEVVLTQSVSTLFVSLLGIDTVDITTRAVAVSDSEQDIDVCVLALERCLNNKEGIILAGSLDLQSPTCAIHSNDSCLEGINFNGNPTISTSCLSTGGTISGGSNNLTLTECDQALELAGDAKDPFAHIGCANAAHGCDSGVTDQLAQMMQAAIPSLPCQGAGGVTASFDARPASLASRLAPIAAAHAASPGDLKFAPGRYCGNMNFGSSGNALLPGIYFVQGNFQIQSQTTISGSGGPVILVYLNDDSTFDMSGQGDLAITAPTADEIANNNAPPPIPAPPDADGDGFPDYADANGDGIWDHAFYPISDAQAADWAGLLIHNNSNVGLGGGSSCANKINGTSDITAVGTIHFPNTCLVFAGNGNISSEGRCLFLVAGNMTLTGNTVLDNSKCDSSYKTTLLPSMVGLVE
jgi:Flp pilus assembly protein TadG